MRTDQGRDVRIDEICVPGAFVVDVTHGSRQNAGAIVGA